MKEKPKGEIIIYKTKGGKTTLEVKLQKETVWLNQVQMSQLFDKDRRTISEHANNIYKEKELQRDRTIRNFRIVQEEGNRRVEREVDFYNLDVIISVGYRVKSQRGTQFRIWATQVLKDHRAEAAGLLHVITDYSYALSLLDQYDHQELKIHKTTRKKHFAITYDDARRAIDKLGEQSRRKGHPIGLFGKEKDKSFKGSLGAIYQTFDGKEVYPSIEEKAAHLLYFVVKNHSFVDGNKRIGAFLFVWFLDVNRILYIKDGLKRIGNNALVALTLMIAESRPKDKDIIIKVIVNLINKDNV